MAGIFCCTKCHTNRPTAEFRKDEKRKNGIRKICKTCERRRNLDYYAKNREKEKLSTKQYSDLRREDIREKSRIYREKHKEYFAAYQRTMRKKPIYRLSFAISAGMRSGLRGKKNSRKWEDLVGYTKHDLMEHLRGTLPQGIKWEDYVSGEANLHIDHIIPVAAHNYRSPADADFKKCWALENLRLLPAKENMQKRVRLLKPFQPSLIGV